jgi:dienelactone hydrolase
VFEYFPGNYVWNLSMNIALAMGASIGELDEASRELRDLAQQGDDEGTQIFFARWCAVAERLIALAEADRHLGRSRSAAGKYWRACAMLMTAERMQRPAYAPREQGYARMLETFRHAVREAEPPCSFVEIPYGSRSFPAVFAPAHNADAATPCMIFCNGLDSVKEMVYLSGAAHELAARGISTLMVDQPGSGGALRQYHLPAVVDSERWASAALDYLQTRPDVDARRIGIMGWSLGGYFAPRAAAFEPRFALCVAWGANYDWGELQRKRLEREGDRPVPHYWEHVQWVWGTPTLDEFMALAPSVSLAGVLHRIHVPFLVTHGANDRQIPLDYARSTYDDAVNSPKRELKIFTRDIGAVEHVGADNLTLPRDFAADWIAQTFAEMRG